MLLKIILPNQIYLKIVTELTGNYKLFYWPGDLLRRKTWDLLSDNNGNYTSFLLDKNKNGNKRLIRTSDGVHLQYFAGYYVADVITAEMEKFLDLRVK